MSNHEKIVQELIKAYWMEIETVQNYLANSVNLDGVRAEEIKKSLADDINEELAHARSLANRIRVLGGTVPGSVQFQASQHSLQPPKESTDVISVIRGVIEAEEAAIQQYKNIIELTDGNDYPTQDMAIALLAEEQEHRREFLGFLKEYEK